MQEQAFPIELIAQGSGYFTDSIRFLFHTWCYVPWVSLPRLLLPTHNQMLFPVIQGAEAAGGKTTSGAQHQQPQSLEIQGTLKDWSHS